MLNSIVQQRGAVTFPAHTGERVYMREFRKSTGLPAHLSRWQSTIDAMLDGVDTDGPIYLMIDQGVVKATSSHRRPGLHIDGYWNPAISAHGGGGRHSGTPSDEGRGGHGGGRHCSGADSWANADYRDLEGLILASDVSASRAMVGWFDGLPGEGGDCSHIDVSDMQDIRLAAGTCYAGNVTMLHESLPVAADCLRTLVRLNVPGWSPA